MRSRPGVSLVEVLVAAVLLAVGVGGAMSALLAAARLRDRAATREAVVRAVEARLGWFAVNACTWADTTVAATDAGVEEAWRISRATAGMARLEGRTVGRTSGAPVRLSLVHERRCP
jgi:Tfp pilus assembly protein PilV